MLNVEQSDLVHLTCLQYSPILVQGFCSGLLYLLAYFDIFHTFYSRRLSDGFALEEMKLH